MKDKLVDPIESAKARESSKSVETSALDEPGLCPMCRVPMQKVLSCGIEAFYCIEHRIALPEIVSDGNTA